MKFYNSVIDACSGIKNIAFLEISEGRALLGFYSGYTCIFFRRFTTKYNFVNTEEVNEVIYKCNIDDMTKAKLENFLNREISIIDRLRYYYKWKKFNNTRYYKYLNF